jgi:hypothetical protein
MFFGGCSPAPGNGTSPLLGTWDLTTTPPGSGPVLSTVTLGQDSLTVTSPSFTLTASRTGSSLAFQDNENPSNVADNATLTGVQTAAAFDAGMVPFNLGGSWTMQVVPNGGTAIVTCTLQVSATEIDGACQLVSPPSAWFSFTTSKSNSVASSFGDFGGTWTNTWIWPGAMGGTYPCELNFSGASLTTCAGGAMNGQPQGSPLAGITFTYDGANTASGAAQGWAEFSATRR